VLTAQISHPLKVYASMYRFTLLCACILTPSLSHIRVFGHEMPFIKLGVLHLHKKLYEIEN
jgi:hypothetical protein